MSAEVAHLDLDDLLRLIREMGVGPVRDIGLLAGCAQRPQTSAFGRDAYPDLPTKAAALLHSIARTHPLVDGNKRLAWLATVVLLDINGWTTDLDDEGAFAVVMDVAQHDMEAADIAVRLKARPIGEAPDQ